MKILFLLLILLFPGVAFSWGGRGHFTLCEAAGHLVKDKNLRAFLMERGYVMGHLCNIPDTQWKDSGAEISSVGSPAHYFDVELVSPNVSEVNLDYRMVIKTYAESSKQSVKKAHGEVGSNWWRADQFYRRAVNEGKEKKIYEFMVNLGVMGHFVGDNGQPLHVTVNYDGKKNGHGGIHAYYEEIVVATLSADLISRVVKEGSRLQTIAGNEGKIKPNAKIKTASINFLKQPSVLEKMRGLAALSYQDIEEIYKLDKLIKPSEIKTEKGMSLKSIAERRPGTEAAKDFEPLIIRQMGRSAALLAQLWDDAYVAAGKPELVSYRSAKFPFQVDFVPPDYVDLTDK